jgi:hypothetical protein
MILNTVKKRTRKPGEVPVSAFSSTLTEKPKRGRRTIPDNFLLGARNAWAALLEESWPEIGWPLLQIRKHRTSTVDDVRKAFQPVKSKPHNPGLAAAFYRETFEVATPTEVRRNRIRQGDLQGQLIHLRAKVDEVQRSVWEIDAALKNAGPEHTSAIEKEIAKRRQELVELQTDFNRLTSEEKNLGEKCSDQEAYVYSSELLDFLRSDDRYGVKPLSIANALAGLPSMRWRQSYSRCARMLYQEPSLHYQVLKIILKLCKRYPRTCDSKEPLIELFRVQVRKLPRKLGYTRDFLWENFRDLRLAVEECLAVQHELGELPYALTSIFMRNTRTQKNSVERILAEQEKLSQG